MTASSPASRPCRPGATTKQTLSVSRRKLLELIQWIRFGTIESLPIRGGEPLMDPPPVVVREYKFGGDNGPHPQLQAPDFLLKVQVVDLFRELDAIRDGTIAVLEVKHGLPFRMFVNEVERPRPGGRRAHHQHIPPDIQPATRCRRLWLPPSATPQRLRSFPGLHLPIDVTHVRLLPRPGGATHAPGGHRR